MVFELKNIISLSCPVLFDQVTALTLQIFSFLTNIIDIPLRPYIGRPCNPENIL